MPMTDRHPLDALLAPNSVAIFGASNDPTRISGRSLRFYREAGFAGALYPINPNRETVQGLTAYPDIAQVPGPVEFALIALPAAQVEAALEAAVAKGVKGAVIFSSGFAEIGDKGSALQDRLVARARQAGLRFCGPNCLGLFNARIGHTPTFCSFLEEGPAQPGPLGLVTQSGAFGTHLLALFRRRGLAAGLWISTGNEADFEVADGIAYLADDRETWAIACYLEGIKDSARFAAAVAHARERGKPVIAMKVGASAVGIAAAVSHTAALAGADAVHDAAFRQFGVERARTPEDLVEIAYACTRGRLPRSRRLSVMTVSGGAGVLMADAAEQAGIELTPLSAPAQAEIRSWVPFAATRNPVDLTAQPLNEPELLDKGFDLLLGGEGFPALAGFFTTWAQSPQMGETLFQAVRGAAARYPDRFLAISVIAPEAVRRRYEAEGVAVFEDPWRAVEAVAAAMRCAERLAVSPASPPAPAKGLPELPAGRVGELAAKRILAAAGIPAIEERLATNAAEAATAAAGFGGHLALKILSPDILHKTDIGGVVLDVPAAEVAAAYERLVAAAKARRPEATIEGVSIAPMLTDGIETIIGVEMDAVWGPVVMFGLGGVFVEVLRDVTFRVAPFGVAEARHMILEIRGAALLAGARGRPEADIDALALALSRLSVFAAARRGHFKSIEINPLLVRPRGLGAVALDALIVTNAAVAK